MKWKGRRRSKNVIDMRDDGEQAHMSRKPMKPLGKDDLAFEGPKKSPKPKAAPGRTRSKAAPKTAPKPLKKGTLPKRSGQKPSIRWKRTGAGKGGGGGKGH